MSRVFFSLKYLKFISELFRESSNHFPLRCKHHNSVRNKNWPIWKYEPSKFQWNYDDKEICLIIEGQAKISTQNGDIYIIKAGDLVEFPAGLNCEWEVTKSIKKHYRLGI